MNGGVGRHLSLVRGGGEVRIILAVGVLEVRRGNTDGKFSFLLVMV